jgi:hypothetical protein
MFSLSCSRVPHVDDGNGYFGVVQTQRKPHSASERLCGAVAHTSATDGGGSLVSLPPRSVFIFKVT